MADARTAVATMARQGLDREETILAYSAIFVLVAAIAFTVGAMVI